MKSNINPINHARRMRDFIFDLIFPIECLSCAKEGVWLCNACFHKLEFNSHQYCLHCKQENKLGQFCDKCQSHYSLNGIWIAGDYENKTIALLIKNLKYRFIKDISQTLGNYLALFLRNLINQNRLSDIDLKQGSIWRKFSSLTQSPYVFLNFNHCLVVPIPLSKKRWRWRGFNQTKNIAEILTSNLNIKLNTNNLIRIKHKKAQAKLKEADRKINIKNCFAWQGDYLNGRDIILIDDVVTTGSTLNECARVLKESGAGEVWGLVVAKG